MRIAAAITLVLAGCLDSPQGSSPDGGDEPSPDAGDVGSCPFDEPFDDPALENWVLSPERGGTVDVLEGRLSLRSVPEAGDIYGYAEAETTTEWGLAGLTVTADLEVSWTGEGFGNAALVLWGPGGNYMGIIADAGSLYVVVGDEYVCDAEPCLAYAYADHRFWRIREAEGNLYFEASGDGDSWNQVGPSQTKRTGTHYVLLWSECDEGTTTAMHVEHVTVECE